MFNIPRIHPDEMIVPWLERVATFNGYDSFKDFYLYMFSSKDTRPTRNMNLEIPDLDRFEPALRYLIAYGNLDSAKNYEELIMNHTLFPFYYSFEKRDNHYPEELSDKPLQESPALNKYDIASYKYHKRGHCPTSPFSLSEVRYCPACMKEDFRKYGLVLSHIKHNIPYVDVCYFHGCALVTFPDGHPDLRGPHDTFNPAPNNLAYARFAVDYLEYTKTFPAIYYGKILKYVDVFKHRMCLTNRDLLDGLFVSGYIHSPADQESFVNKDYRTVYERDSIKRESFFSDEDEFGENYTRRRIQCILCCLLYLFGDVKTFSEGLKEYPSDSIGWKQYEKCVSRVNCKATERLLTRIGNAQCDLSQIVFCYVNPLDDILVLKCRLCGKKFRATKKELLCGTRCPCRKKVMPLSAIRRKVLKRSLGSVHVYPVESRYMLVCKPNLSGKEPRQYPYEYISSELSRLDYSPLFDWFKTIDPGEIAWEKKDLRRRAEEFIRERSDTVLTIRNILKRFSDRGFFLDTTERENIVINVLKNSADCEFVSADEVHFFGTHNTQKEKEAAL